MFNPRNIVQSCFKTKIHFQSFRYLSNSTILSSIQNTMLNSQKYRFKTIIPLFNILNLFNIFEIREILLQYFLAQLNTFSMRLFKSIENLFNPVNPKFTIFHAMNTYWHVSDTFNTCWIHFIKYVVNLHEIRFQSFQS